MNVQSVTMTDPLTSRPPPSPKASSAPVTVIAVTLTYVRAGTVSTGPAQLAVAQPAGSPPLPSSTGALDRPGHAWMVTGRRAEVPVVAIDQFPL